ncbi:hypothetical protein [Nonomuraea sp. NPDC049709]|uniref:maleate cis-trans isomerase family protein n=1 Tax=Nonomuraea sp. NPDC049709 TaxID=3154736 RepID=UPI003442FD98
MTTPPAQISRHPLGHSRVGLIVPPANAVAEPEVTHLLAPHATTHTTRLPVLHKPLADRLSAYNEAVPDMIASFGQLGLLLDAVVLACSGSRYPLGPNQDADRCEQWSTIHGVPVSTATLATWQVLQRLGSKDLVLISPYEPWLTEQACAYWEQAGLRVEVVGIQTAAHTYAPYQVQPAELVDQIERADLPDDAVLLCTGTGMATLGVLPLLGAGNKRVLLTSNLCTAWWALHRLGPIPRQSLPWPLYRLAAQGLR